MSSQRYTVMPSVGYHWTAVNQRRQSPLRPCPFTGRTVTVELVDGADAETIDVETGLVAWLPMRRLEVVP